MGEWTLYLMALVAAGSLVLSWIIEQSRHFKLTEAVPIRVHVNGIRGKSSITRYIIAALRAGGYEVVGKTTGSGTRLMMPDGSEVPVQRIGAPTILEQLDLLRLAIRSSTDAIVVECMALNPAYQTIAEQRMIRATDGIIANVRRDHVDVLGHTLEEIAASLCSTAPKNGHLYTAVEDADLLGILESAAHGPLITVRGEEVSAEEIEPFGPMAVAENVALALAVAERHGVARDKALAAMVETAKDPGASVIELVESEAGKLHWINLFSVNDVPSVQMVLGRVLEDLPDLPIVLLLNTRGDRSGRTAEFTEWIAQSLPDTRVLEMGDASDLAASRLQQAGATEQGEIHIGKNESRDDLVAHLLDVAGTDEAIVVGLANIHTKDAERIMSLFEDAA